MASHPRQHLLTLVVLALLLNLVSSTFTICSSATYKDSYTSLPSAAVFPTSTLSAALTRTPSSDDPLTENHWSEVAKYGNYRPPAFTPVANPTQTNCPHLWTNTSNWHNPAIWSGGAIPTNGSNINIPANTAVLVASCSIDPSFVFGNITIPVGSALILGDASIAISASGFTVAGAFLVGSPTCRLRNSLSITLYGSRDAQPLPAPSVVKGIAVTGQIDIHGMQYFPTWSRLAMTARVNDTVIFIQDVVNWQAGQSIFITTTEIKDSRDWHRNEVRNIVSVQLTTLGTSVAAITVDEPLSYLHYGGSEYQAEVGLLTRNILVQGDAFNSEATDNQNASCTDSTGAGSTYPCTDQFLTGFGGHVQVMTVGAIGRFSGVELYRMGQTNQLGRYPLHFHLLNQTNNGSAFGQDCSVHHSFFRCYVIHGTHGALYTQNTAYDAIGSCFYLSEDGVEENSTISYNLAAHVHMLGFPQNPSESLNGDSFYGQTLSYYTNSSSLLIPSDLAAGCFYVTDMYNNIFGNAASGGWTGFSFPSLPLPIQDYRTVTNFNPSTRPFASPLRGNTAHSSGFWWGSASAFYFGGELFYSDAALTTLSYTAGRTQSNVHDTCTDSTAGTVGADQAGCYTLTDQLWLEQQDNKAFLSNRGLQAWGNRADIVRMEVLDVGLSMNVFGEVSALSLTPPSVFLPPSGLSSSLGCRCGLISCS